jgi:hypothetical protein
MKVNHKKDKELLLKLSKSLGISKSHIQKDDLNYWCILGKETWIDTDGEFWYLHITESSNRSWNGCKRALDMEVQIDCDGEGVLRSSEMPTERESKIIRKLLGLRQSYLPLQFSKIAPAIEGFLDH